jgi:hypothetical protein
LVKLNESSLSCCSERSEIGSHAFDMLLAHRSYNSMEIFQLSPLQSLFVVQGANDLVWNRLLDIVSGNFQVRWAWPPCGDKSSCFHPRIPAHSGESDLPHWPALRSALNILFFNTSHAFYREIRLDEMLVHVPQDFRQRYPRTSIALFEPSHQIGRSTLFCASCLSAQELYWTRG